MITTDHISPAGSFKETTPAGAYLVDRQVPIREFNSYGSRRGNHEIMMRGTFANIRIKNEMLDGLKVVIRKALMGSRPLYTMQLLLIKTQVHHWLFSVVSNTARDQAGTGLPKVRRFWVLKR